MAKKKILAGKMGNSKYFFDENGNIVDQTGAVAPRAIAAAILAGIESIPEVEVEDKAPAKPKAPKKVKQAKSKEETEEEESPLSRVTQRVSSGRGPIRGTIGNIADVVGRGTIAASVGSVPNLRGVAAATLDAAGVGGLAMLGGGGGGRRVSSPGGGKNLEKESVGILESILNVLQDNNELLQDLLSSLTTAAKDRIESAREANRKAGEAGKGVTDTDTKELEEQSFLGKWSKIIAAALGSVYGIILGWLKTVKFFAEALLPESLIKSIKGKFTAIGTFFDDVFLKLKTLFTKNIQNISVVFEEAFSKISNLFKSVGSESRLAKILTAFGQGIIRLSAPFIEAFNVLKSLISGPANYIVNVFKSFSGIFDDVAKVAGNMLGFLDNFAGVFKFVSSIVSKLALPLFIVMTVWDTVKGMIEGYEKEGIVGAIAGAVTGFFNSLIFGPLDMLKSAVAWVLGKFGFENAEKELNSFSFSEMFTNLIGTVKDFFIDIGKWVGEKMAGASASFSEWWNSWSITGAITTAFEGFKVKAGGLLNGVIEWWNSWTLVDVISTAFENFKTNVGNLLAPVIEWWNSWSITGAITTAFEDFKQKIINYFGPEFVAKIGEIASFDLAGYISKKIGEAIDTVKNMFGNLGNMVNDYAYDLWESTVGGFLPNPLTKSSGTPDSESETGMAAGRGAERSVLAAVKNVTNSRPSSISPRVDTEPTFNNAEDSVAEATAEPVDSMITDDLTNRLDTMHTAGVMNDNLYKMAKEHIKNGRISMATKMVMSAERSIAPGGDITADKNGISANFGNVMAETVSATDLIPTTNQTAPAFLKRVNDLAVSSSAPAAPIIIDNTTKNTVTNSRPSSISPRVSSGAPKTAPVMSHIERSLYPFIGAYP